MRLGRHLREDINPLPLEMDSQSAQPVVLIYWQYHPGFPLSKVKAKVNQSLDRP